MWFSRTFAAATACQLRAWPSIRARRHTLVAAPTGSGKTLAAFLTAIDDLVRQSVAGTLDDGVQTLYISPLKALSNDIQRNLEVPLAGIEECLEKQGYARCMIRSAVRTGDTPVPLRALMKRRPPHLLVTTPESLYILLTSDSGRDMLRTVRTVIVDEIHALAANKRGAHLALSLERLTALTAQPPVRIGLSATQRPIEEIARYLVGCRHLDAAGNPDCTIIDESHVRARDLAIEMPRSPLEAVLAAETGAEIYDRIAELIAEHRTTLIFVNTRRMAERVAKALSDRVGGDAITPHHGSMAKERRLDAEQRLKAGQLKALVATASLELGIDIGEVDLVCQIGSTRTLAMFLQRVGRSGHTVGGLAKGRLFPQTRDDLVESVALLDMTRRGELDHIEIPKCALDVLAQQIVAEAACADCSLADLFASFTSAYPYRALSRADFDKVVQMLVDGFAFALGRHSAYLHLDAVNGIVRARRGARLTALTCGGAIPDTADYDVIAEPHGHMVGTVNEDFAIESLPGNIFQLGNTSWKILRVEASSIRVEDAAGQPPNIPFWLGEAPARSVELSQAVSRLREEFAQRVDADPVAANTGTGLQTWLANDLGVGPVAARQLYDYLLAGYRALGAMPTQQTLVMERFFDESGGMQLVIHSPFGSRINRAWGLALRKRFCRQFNFELQAAAVEDAIVISLGAVHSFPLADVWQFLKAETVRDVLVQAVLDAPIFAVRWRWVACCALALRRFRAGVKVPPRLMRMQADDLVSLVFPDQLACAENLQGRREIPDHPLVAQALADCLHEAMDIESLEALLRAIERGEKTLIARDQTEPSPFAQAVLNANPYAFLDDAPLEERRTQAVQSRRWLDPASASDLGALDPQAILRVRDEAWPDPTNVEELHDALLVLGVASPMELAGSGNESLRADSPPDARWVQELAAAGRALSVSIDGQEYWLATERVPDMARIWPGLDATSQLISADASRATVPGREDAIKGLLRNRLEVSGPVTAGSLSARFGLSPSEVEYSLLMLENEGVILRGQFNPNVQETEWCDRRLLARIHRYTLSRLREEIEPVPAATFMRFLFEWQYVAPGARLEGPQATQKVVEQLAGFEAAAAAWESDILSLRIYDYSPAYLDQLLSSGRAAWLRLTPKTLAGGRLSGPLRSTPINILPRNQLKSWLMVADPNHGQEAPAFGGATQAVFEYLAANGASFFDDVVTGTGLLKSQCELSLGELAACGLVTADSFAGLRVLLTPSTKRRPLNGSRRRRVSAVGMDDVGRWELVKRPVRGTANFSTPTEVDVIVKTLLARYGVVFRRLLEREANLPPWRELLGLLRRLEARGEVRGGRFVAGFSGEQFALPGAVETLRRLKKTAPARQFIGVSSTDPLNLVGIVLPGLRIPAVLGNRIAFLDGEAVAIQLGNEVRFLKDLTIEEQTRARTALLGPTPPASLRFYLRR